MRIPQSARAVVVTNPLVIYRSLVARERIKPDPAQHRLAIYLEKLYLRLKDYKPRSDLGYQIQQLQQSLNATNGSRHPKSESLGEGQAILSGWRERRDSETATALTRRLTDHESAIQITSPRGLLLHGDVGTGKSLLLDLLAECLPNQGKRRWHFNTFMLTLYAQLEEIRKSNLAMGHEISNKIPQDYPLLCIARRMVSKSPILFLDEFQLPDRATAKILSNFFTSFFHLGGVLIASSNRMPEDLASAAGVEFTAKAPSGFKTVAKRLGLVHPSLQRLSTSRNKSPIQNDFIAFLEVLKSRCEVWSMDSQKDWRRDDSMSSLTEIESNAHESREKIKAEPGKLTLDPSRAETERTMPTYYVDYSKHCAESQSAFQRMISEAAGTGLEKPAWEPKFLQVYGRKLTIPQASEQVCEWTFIDICGANYGSADYVTMASNFHTVIISKVPILTHFSKNEARRFITLIDALYESRCRLLLSAAAPPDELFFPLRKTEAENGQSAEPADGVYPETFAEIYQDQTSPFRPSVSSYSASASSPNYADSDTTTSASQLSRTRSILADEDSDFGPVYDSGRSSKSLSAFNRPPDFSNTTSFTGDDERFAYKRAVSRIWEMCGTSWWAREGDWWRPIEIQDRHWERSSIPSSNRIPRTLGDIAEPAQVITSPFRKSAEAPPKFHWSHAWGMMKWGKKAGAWGQGPAGLVVRKEKGDTKDAD